MQHLEETDYADYLQNDQVELSIPLLRQKLKKKLADELDFISAQTVGSLSKFINLMKHKYMIDNVVNMIEGIKNKVPTAVFHLSLYYNPPLLSTGVEGRLACRCRPVGLLP